MKYTILNEVGLNMGYIKSVNSSFEFALNKYLVDGKERHLITSKSEAIERFEEQILLLLNHNKDLLKQARGKDCRGMLLEILYLANMNTLDDVLGNF